MEGSIIIRYLLFERLIETGQRPVPPASQRS
jgi:hypothetical protein